jgi:nucleotide-binding universal stress UspA family protein
MAKGPMSTGRRVELDHPDGRRDERPAGSRSVDPGAVPATRITLVSAWEVVVMTGSEPGRVVVGVCRSLGGYQALRYAVAQARERGATVVAVRAYSAVASREALWRTALAEAAIAEIGAAFTEAFGGMPHDVTVRVAVTEGLPGPALVATADRADDLLVIGGSGSHRLTRAWSTAVARYCARHAQCPVLIAPVPAMARARGAGRLARAAAFAAEESLRSSDRSNPTSPQRP